MAGNSNRIPVESKRSNVRLFTCEIPRVDSIAPPLISINIQNMILEKYKTEIENV